jgi:hypothetical protein
MPESDASPPPPRALRHWLLLAILALAAMLRGLGLGFGLAPHGGDPVLHPLARPDEQYLWSHALGIYAGDPNPHFFLYPSLFMYVLAGADALYALLGSLFAGSREAVEAAWLYDPRALIWIDRGVVAAIGALTTLLVYRLVAETFGRREGLVAALLIALAHLHVRDSRFGVTDVPLAALACLVLREALRIERLGRWRDYAAAGGLAGLALSIKYSGAVLAAPIVAAHLLRPGAFAPRALARLAGALALVPVGFLIGTPFALLAWGEFREGVLEQLAAQASPTWLGVDLGPGGWQHLRFTLWHGLGPPLLLASLAGFGVGLRRAPRAALVWLAFAVPYFALFARGQLAFARYMVPLVPLLCATAAVAIGTATSRLPRARLAAALALALLLALPSLREAIDGGRLLARTDSRVLAAAWLRDRVAPDDTLLMVGAVFADPPLVLRGRKAYDPFAWPPRFWADRLELPRGPELLRVRNGMDPALDALVREERVSWVVVAESPLQAYGPTVSLERRLADFRRVATFEGVGRDPRMRFDLQDAFYAPFAGARHAPRPGPNLHVYLRYAARRGGGR